ncbi:hypothetical protein EI982_08075 [Haloplanus rallus]|jgi:hypothetical protein|uniref:Uncharacterized protein n=1 Tax=Haloplanus rallus TaxID=1816183 RepID=A0A6B9F2Z9_9EURY|nr:hypothetical protein EI982_08075 [Haloplanus rallus]
MSFSDRVHHLRQPEYTGENRCVPCTVVNLAIAALLGGLVAMVSPPLAVAVFAGSVAAIYLRGYLVPGTPTLTKRYLPDAVLKLFDKHDPDPPAIADEADIESFLIEVDAVEECRDGTDLCLTEAFRTAWNERIHRLRERGDEDEGIAALFEGLDIDTERVRVESYGDAYEAYIDDTRVGQWESRAAYLADLAAEGELRDRHAGWHRLGFDARTEVLGSLRLWLERCPSCDGPVTLGEDTVESCCRSIDVIAATCEDCEARVFEAQFSPEAMAAD